MRKTMEAMETCRLSGTLIGSERKATATARMMAAIPLKMLTALHQP
jgi:hypothetical protein